MIGHDTTLRPRGGDAEPTAAERSSLLAYVAKVLALEVELDRLLPRIVGYATEVLHADRSSLFLYDAGTAELYGRITEGAGEREIRFPADRGIAGAALAAGKPLLVDDAYADGRFDRRWDERTGYRTESVLAVPILSRAREVLGVIQALNRRGGGGFSWTDVEHAEVFGAHVSVALERAMLTEAYADRQKMRAMLEMARDVQKSLLPVPGRMLGAVDVSAYLAPAESVAGDLYDWFEIDAGRIGFAIGDVAGKGMPAALQMAGIQAMMRGFGRQGLPPARCLDLINRTKRGRSSVFTSLIYGILDTASGLVEYANAGHCPPVLLRASGGARMLERAGQLPLSSVQRSYAARTVQLGHGDALVLYTDGVLEASDSEGEQFGEDRLLTAVRSSAGAAADSIVHRLLAAVQAFTGLDARSDDLTVLAIRRR